MALDLADTLVVGISSTALYDLSEPDQAFWARKQQDPEGAIAWYRQYMRERETEPLSPGTGYPLVRALLRLNAYQRSDEPPLVEVVVMSQNSPETGLRILHAIRRDGLGISRSAFTGGESVVPYLEAFDVDLFLTTHAADAERVIASRVCAAAALLPPPEGIDQLPEDQVRIAFDGDAVLFDADREWVYRQRGLEAFHREEVASEDLPLGDGPYATFLRKLARLQERLPTPVEWSPVRIAIVTARNSPADIRVIKTLRAWGVYVDMAFFLGGVEKARVLRALRPHIFFDDQRHHLDPAARIVPAGHVPGMEPLETASAQDPARTPGGTK
ncbi:MAG: 5'-nucleotidase [Firmicutes bacterium]|nr:5'-nucleotidase [Bacillota bacterium]